MPKTTKKGTARQDELPSTLQRSDEKAQRTYAKTLDSAEETYDDPRRAHQVAFSALKHTHEKVGDHWGPRTTRARATPRPRAAPAPIARPRAGWTPTPPRSTSTSWPPGWRSAVVPG